MQSVHDCHDSWLDQTSTPRQVTRKQQRCPALNSGELAAELAPGENTWLPVPDSQRHWKSRLNLSMPYGFNQILQKYQIKHTMIVQDQPRRCSVDVVLSEVQPGFSSFVEGFLEQHS